jgi:hypothetical protein
VLEDRMRANPVTEACLLYLFLLTASTHSNWAASSAICHTLTNPPALVAVTGLAYTKKDSRQQQ